jgi:hypothetical protein
MDEEEGCQRNVNGAFHVGVRTRCRRERALIIPTDCLVSEHLLAISDDERELVSMN